MFTREFITGLALSVSRRAAVILAAAGLILPCGCDLNQLAAGLCAPTTKQPGGPFVGSIAQSAALLALDVTRCAGNDRVRIFLTDGASDGDTEFFEGQLTGDKFDFMSRSGRARIEGQVTDVSVDGTITLADGVARALVAAPAIDGAGLYEVTVSDDGVWQGIGPGGATLEADQNGNLVSGVITDGSGRQTEYVVNDLSRVFTEPATGGLPDNYLLIVLPRGDAQIGRGGAENVKAGIANTSANFIRLDLPLSPPTPGTFFGRFQDLPDLIGFEFDEPDSAGIRHLRAFVTNAIAPPNGRAEWFTADFAGEFPNESLVLPSISGNARISSLKAHDAPDLSTTKARRARAPTGTTLCPVRCLQLGDRCICLFGISGSVELADGTRHAFYAVPAGEGAGIYEVKLAPGGMHGMSVKGGMLDIHADGQSVIGTLTTPDGVMIEYQADDFGGSFGDPNRSASAPDTFVVLVAPHGRFIVGNPGNVHGFIVSVEMLFITVILVIGIIGGLAARPARPQVAPPGTSNAAHP